ncbi:MAG TPA: response regulator [Thermoanaerobaculia bacterium]|nr:response regulator [Thermoanaerobaculia bacterium]
MKTILVVDDEPSVLFALSEGLTDRRRGVRVATAANGIEAVAVLEAEAIDLVLTDLRMPDMDGFELLTFLRRNHAALPVILMTALGDSDISSRLATAGSFELLPKPFDLPDLKRKIAEMLAQSVKGRVENISLASFLQLLEMERKTCTLSIRSHHPEADREGKLYFRAGRLIGATTGAVTGATRGRDAALEIVTWEHADIEIADGCPPIDPEIESPLSFLLMEGMRLKDEQGRPPEPVEVEEPDLDATLIDLPPRSQELSRLLSERMSRGKGTKGVEAILLVDLGGNVLAGVGEGEKRGAEIAAAAARFLRDRALSEPLQELLVTTADRYWLFRLVGGGRRFLLLLLDRHLGNLARAQLDLVEIERGL